MGREQRVRAVLEHASDLITFVDARGNVLFDSPSIERLLGYPPGERAGRSIFELLHPEDIEKARAAFETATAARSRTPLVEIRLRHKDGRWRLFESIGSYVDNGEPMGIVHSRDISERRQLEEQLRQAQKMEALGRLTGTIAHDFNNVLTVILGASEGLLDAEAAQPVHAEVREIHRAASMGASLTRQLLRFSRRLPAVFERLDLNEIVRELSAFFQRLVGKEIRLDVDLIASRPIVNIDKGLLYQLFMNLIINARDAMPQGGVLTLSTREGAGRSVILEVRDTGQGISADVQTQLFEPFFTTKDAGQGTGLGLATVYSIVVQSNGTIDVESTEGRGTTFRITLPRAE